MPAAPLADPGGRRNRETGHQSLGSACDGGRASANCKPRGKACTGWARPRQLLSAADEHRHYIARPKRLCLRAYSPLCNKQGLPAASKIGPAQNQLRGLISSAGTVKPSALEVVYGRRVTPRTVRSTVLDTGRTHRKSVLCQHAHVRKGAPDWV
jgi:hypothetical protein